MPTRLLVMPLVRLDLMDALPSAADHHAQDSRHAKVSPQSSDKKQCQIIQGRPMPGISKVEQPRAASAAVPQNVIICEICMQPSWGACGSVPRDFSLKQRCWIRGQVLLKLSQKPWREAVICCELHWSTLQPLAQETHKWAIQCMQAGLLIRHVHSLTAALCCF